MISIDLASFLLAALGAVSGGVGVYVGIRTDLARHGERLRALSERIEAVNTSTSEAHKRIDGVLGRN